MEKNTRYAGDGGLGREATGGKRYAEVEGKGGLPVKGKGRVAETVGGGEPGDGVGWGGVVKPRGGAPPGQ